MPKVSYEAAGKSISGEYVVRDGLITTASDGRSMQSTMDDSMLSEQTLAKTLCFNCSGMRVSIEPSRIAANIAKLPEPFQKR